MKALKNLQEGSANERVFARMLEKLGIKYEYEPFTNDIIKAVNGTIGRYAPTQYTPDFVMLYNDRKIIIETKGFMRGRDALIVKIADAWYTSRGYEYYCINQAGKVSTANLDYYLYKSKGIAKRGAKTKTFWQLIGMDITPEESFKLFRECQIEIRQEDKDAKAA